MCVASDWNQGLIKEVKEGREAVGKGDVDVRNFCAVVCLTRTHTLTLTHTPAHTQPMTTQGRRDALLGLLPRIHVPRRELVFGAHVSESVSGWVVSCVSE